MIMDEYELDSICDQADCNCECFNCPIMAEWNRTRLGR